MRHEDLLYPIADSLQMTLYPSGPKEALRIRGAASLVVHAGPWPMAWSIRVEVDQLGAKYASAYVKFAGDLWGYFISNGLLVTCLLFDAAGAGAPVTKDHSVSTTSMRDTLTQLRPHIKKMFSFQNKEGVWIDGDIDSIYPKKADGVDQ